MSSSIPSWPILTAHAQPFRGARDLAFCLKVTLDSLLVWARSYFALDLIWLWILFNFCFGSCITKPSNKTLLKQFWNKTSIFSPQIGFDVSVFSFFVYCHGICIIRIVSLRLTIVNWSDLKFMASVMVHTNTVHVANDNVFHVRLKTLKLTKLFQPQ